VLGKGDTKINLIGLAAALLLLAGCGRGARDAADNSADAAAASNSDAGAESKVLERAHHYYEHSLACLEATDRLHRAVQAAGSPEMAKETETYMASAKGSVTTSGAILGMSPAEIEAGFRDSRLPPEARRQDAEFVRGYLSRPHGKFEGEQFLQHFLQPCEDK
jgi:hypothetical protein